MTSAEEALLLFRRYLQIHSQFQEGLFHLDNLSEAGNSYKELLIQICSNLGDAVTPDSVFRLDELIDTGCLCLRDLSKLHPDREKDFFNMGQQLRLLRTFGLPLKRFIHRNEAITLEIQSSGVRPITSQ